MTKATPAARKRNRGTISDGARQLIIELAGQRLSVYAITKQMNASRFKPPRAQRWSPDVIKHVLQREGLYEPRPHGAVPEEIQDRVMAMHLADESQSAIARTLDAEGVPTARGGKWSASTVGTILRRRGVIAAESNDGVQDADRFREQVIAKPDGHRAWKGRKDARERGLFRVDGKTIKAHRYAWMLAHGSLADDARLRNTCGDTTCVNAEHWRIRGTEQEEFWGRTQLDHETDCVNWTGALDAKGYGKYKSGAAHRAAYEWEHGRLKPGVKLHHICRNKACVKPAHLLPVAGNSDHAALHHLEDELGRALANERLGEDLARDSGRWPEWLDDRLIGSLTAADTDATENGAS